MNCLQCGQINQTDARLCASCGAFLHATDNPTARTPDAPEANAASDLLLGRIIEGRYRIEDRLGVGGMGTVYRAARLHIGDHVAIKILHQHQDPGLQSAERFRREAQAMARLKHPNAVSIYDFGITAEGLQYLVMEWVEGQNLKEWIAQRGDLVPALVAEIAGQVCEGLEEAHEQGIIHRDLKPDNIIVQQRPNGVRVKVLDFGIAQLLGETASHLTQTGNLVGTPHYMSPEQCFGEALDARSDIYSLGVILYEMLSGKLPFNAPVATAVVIQHINQAPPPLGGPNFGIPPGFENLVMRALAKRPEHRPQTARHLAQELKEFASDATSGVGYSSVHNTPSSFPHPTAPQSAQSTAPTRVLNQELLSEPQPAVRSRSTGTTVALVVVAMLLITASFLTVRYVLQKGSNSTATEASSAAVDYSTLTQVRTLKIGGPENSLGIRSLYLSPDGHALIIDGWEQMNADSAGTTILWDTRNGTVHDLDSSEGYIFAVVFAPDGSTVATARGYSYGPLKLWDWRTGRLIRDLSPVVDDHDNTVHHLVLSADGRILAASGGGPFTSGQSQYRVQVWDLRSGGTIRTFYFYQTGSALAFSPDHKVLAHAVGSEVKLWDTQTWNEIPALSGSYEDVNDLLFSPDGRLLATLSNDGVMRLWDAKTWKVKRILSGHKGKPDSFSFSPDGTVLASVSAIFQSGEVASSEIKLWDVATGDVRLTIGSETRLKYAISSDSRKLASASSVIQNDEVLSAEVKVWDVQSGELQYTLDKNTGLRYAAEIGFSPDGRTLVSGGWTKTSTINDGARTKFIGEGLTLWDAGTGQMKRELPGGSVFVFSRDGQFLATGNDDGEVKLWSVEAAAQRSAEP